MKTYYLLKDGGNKKYLHNINLGKHPSLIKLNNNTYYYDLYNEEELETDNVYLGERESLMLRRLE